MFLTYKYKLNLTNTQFCKLESILESQRILYNAALEERVSAYQKSKISISFFDQCKSITEIRSFDNEADSLPSCIQRGTLKRLDEAMKGFFRRIKQGDKAGFPRFRNKNRWRSFGFNEFKGIRIKNNKLLIRGISSKLKINWYRDLPSEPKSCVFVKGLGGWSICFIVEVEPVYHINTDSIGIDLGIESLAILSSGERIPNLRYAKKSQCLLKVSQRALARCERCSKRRVKVKNQVTRIHTKIVNSKNTHLHQVSADLIRRYGKIAIEDLNIKGLAKGMLAKSVHDVAWGRFTQMLQYKAERAGSEVVKVDPRYTSQTCSQCGVIKKKELSERVHDCPCGLILDRDHNAAIVIWQRGVVVPQVANGNPVGYAVDLERPFLKEIKLGHYRTTRTTTTG